MTALVTAGLAVLLDGAFATSGSFLTSPFKDMQIKLLTPLPDY